MSKRLLLLLSFLLLVPAAQAQYYTPPYTPPPLTPPNLTPTLPNPVSPKLRIQEPAKVIAAPLAPAGPLAKPVEAQPQTPERD